VAGVKALSRGAGTLAAGCRQAPGSSFVPGLGNKALPRQVHDKAGIVALCGALDGAACAGGADTSEREEKPGLAASKSLAPRSYASCRPGTHQGVEFHPGPCKRRMALTKGGRNLKQNPAPPGQNPFKNNRFAMMDGGPPRRIPVRTWGAQQGGSQFRIADSGTGWRGCGGPVPAL